jgi:imidazole glycerol-phosphate synthase subunit HisF
MSLLRLIPRLDIKSDKLIKPVRMEGLRVIGDPNEYARRYQDADELLYIDTVASLYGRNNLTDILERTTSEVFIPVTVGGGIKSIEDVQRVFGSGADKVAINTGALKNPQIITRIAERYGSQAIVVSIEAKRVNGGWEAYTDNGRERTRVNVLSWVREAVDRGAGELLITSIDQEGTMKGFDCELISRIGPCVDVPVIASGGMGTIQHCVDVLDAGADAVAFASVLHYNRLTLQEIRDGLAKSEFHASRKGREGRSEARSESGV